MQIEKNPLWRAGKHPLLWGCLLLTAVTVLNNWPMAAFDFAWDDYGYVVRNYPIQDPVSLKSLLWCLTAFAEANWHPMTWLALHLQFQFFGLNPGGYHVTNLLLHIANTLLLYALLYRTTRAVGKSLFVAALFAVHPLHIESVAWISEIKDVLSTFFFLLMLHAYVSYARRPGLWRYGLVGMLLAMGLASKPMLVTAPFVMLLLDYWPLGRWTGGPEAVLTYVAGPRYSARRLILEKLPFFAMVGVVCVLTFLAQREGGAVSSLSAVPALMRLSNVVNSYIMYVWRMAWPSPLSFFYAYEPVPLWKFLLCFCGLTFLSFLTWRTRSTKPYLIFGWLWYLGTLVPVIGIVQVGAQAIADRYTYIPSIGILIAFAWYFDCLKKRINTSPLLPLTLSIAIIFSFMCLSLDYLLKWINEEELYSYGLTIDKDNVMALNNYGLILTQLQNTDEAIKHFEHNIQINPKSTGSRTNLASIYISKEDYSKALEILLEALQTDQNNETIYLLLGQVFNQTHDYEIAEKLFRKSLEQRKPQPKTIIALTDLLIKQGRYTEAIETGERHLSSLHDKDQQKAMLLWCLGRANLSLGDFANAQIKFDEALRLQPIFPNARRELAKIAISAGNTDKALEQLKKSLNDYKLDATSRIYLGELYVSRRQYSRAYEELKRALSNEKGIAHPDLVTAHALMGMLLNHFGKSESAEIHKARAMDIQRLSQPNAAEFYRQRLFSTVITQQRNTP